MSYNVEAHEHMTLVMETFEKWSNSSPNMFFISSDGHKILTKKIIISFFSPMIKDIIESMNQEIGISVNAPSSQILSMLNVLTKGVAVARDKEDLEQISDLIQNLGIDFKNWQIGTRRRLQTIEIARLSENKPKAKNEAEVKPIVSKPADEEVYRPSKNKTLTLNNNLEQPKPVQKAEQNNGGEDFPSLGKAAKKLTRNFVSAEEKLVQQKSVFTKWGKTVSQAEQSLQNTHISYGNTGTQKNRVNGKKSKSWSSYKYIAPTNFNERNSGLITSITDLIGIKSLEFKQFKDISGKYRNGQLDSDVYYVQCRELLEEKNFRKVFPELLSLLPDIEKQQQLYQLYKQDQWFDNDSVSECPVSGQICLKKDMDSHLKRLQEEDFPSL